MTFLVSGLAAVLALLPAALSEVQSTQLGSDVRSRADLACDVPGLHNAAVKVDEKNGLTLAQCLSACQANSNCASVQIAKSGTHSGRCFLFSKDTAVARTKDDPSGTWRFYDRGCSAATTPTAPVCDLRGLHSGPTNRISRQDGLTLAQCLSACQDNSDCASAQYARGGKYKQRCYLFSVNATAARAKDDPQGNWHFYDRNCTATEEVPAPVCGVVGNSIKCKNGLLQTIKTGSGTAEKCSSACRSNPACKSFHIRRPESGGSEATACYLLRSNATSCKGPGTTGIYYDTDCVIAPPPPTCGIVGNSIKCKNGLLQTIKTGSGTAEKCSSACRSNPACKSFHIRRPESGGSEATACYLLRNTATACKGTGKTGIYFDVNCPA